MDTRHVKRKGRRSRPVLEDSSQRLAVSFHSPSGAQPRRWSSPETELPGTSGGEQVKPRRFRSWREMGLAEIGLAQPSMTLVPVDYRAGIKY
jgi:hypothetical protein